MAEEPKMVEKGKKKFVPPRICLHTVKETTRATNSTPPSPMRKIKTPKLNCLCSPTTHVGSFRCRYHRTFSPSISRSSLSVGAKLSELTDKSSAVADTLHAH